MESTEYKGEAGEAETKRNETKRSLEWGRRKRAEGVLFQLDEGGASEGKRHRALSTERTIAGAFDLGKERKGRARAGNRIIE